MPEESKTEQEACRTCMAGLRVPADREGRDASHLRCRESCGNGLTDADPHQQNAAVGHLHQRCSLLVSLFTNVQPCSALNFSVSG